MVYVGVVWYMHMGGGKDLCDKGMADCFVTLF